MCPWAWAEVRWGEVGRHTRFFSISISVLALFSNRYRSTPPPASCLAWLVVLFAGIELENVFISPERHSISTWPAPSAAIKSLKPPPPPEAKRQPEQPAWCIGVVGDQFRLGTPLPLPLPSSLLHCVVRVFVISCRVPTVPCEAVRNANAVP